MRAWTSEAAAALQAGTAVLVMLAEMVFDSGTLRLASSNTDIVDNDSPSNTWSKSGLLWQVEEITDKTGNDVAGVTLTLGGVDSSIIAIALAEPARGRPIRVLLGVLDPTTYSLLDTLQFFSGQMATMPVSQQDNKATIRLTAEHRGVLFSRAKPVRYTDYDQQRYHPGDRCLEFIADQSQHNVVWPAASFYRQ